MFGQALQIRPSYDENTVHSQRAHRLFSQLYTGAGLHALTARLRGRSAQLIPLALALQNASIHSRHYAGVRSVALDEIYGSESRSADFDPFFRPRHRHMVQRWTRVASAWLAGVVFAPVELIQVGGGYFVRDGHHRISVARALGQLTIEAEVTIWEVSSRPVRAEQSAQTKGPSTNCQPAYAF